MASSIFSRSILFTAQMCLGIVLTLLLSGSALAQGPRIAARPDRGTMPNGSYAVSDFENISLQNGNVSLSIPLASLPPIAGGKLSWTISAHYNSKLWNITKTQVEAQGTAQFHSYVVDTPAVSELGGWRISDRYKISFRPASADFGYLTEVPFNSLHEEAPDDMTYTNYQLLTKSWHKVVLSMPDGSEHELRPVDYAPYNGSQDFLKGYYEEYPSELTPMRYYSFDGSFLYATVSTDSNWTVYMPDGTRVIENGGIQRIQDTNGNKIKIYNDSNGDHYQDEQTGREIRYLYNPTGNDGQPMGTVSYQTVEGTWVHAYIKFGTTYVHGQVYNVKDWPPGDPGPQPCERQEVLNQSLEVVREIVLPQSELGKFRKFEFKYNSDPEFDETATTPLVRLTCQDPSQSYTRTRSKGLGALREMKTPSKAIIKYAYSLDSFPFHIETDKIAEESITKKEVTYNNETTTDMWEYTVTASGGTVKNPDLSIITESKYTHKPGFSFSIGKAGLSYRTTKPFTKVERHWVDMPFNGVYLDSPAGPVSFNPVVDVEYTTLLDVNGNALKMTAKAFQYDYNGNVLQTTEYDWFDPALITARDAQEVPMGIPGSATVLRVSNNSYYNQATSSTSGNIYANRPRSNPDSKLILNAIKESTIGASQTRFSYDGEAYGTDPSVGNLTNVSKWDNVTNSWISTSMTYGDYGNLSTTTDARGKVTQIFYEDTTHALPTRVVVDPQNGTGQQESRTEYDYSTGAVTSQTDPNNKITNIYYSNPLLDGAIDPFGRPGAVYSPEVMVNGTPQRHRTTTIYEDHLRRVTVASDLNAPGDGLLKSQSTQDELGRTILTEQSEDGVNYTISSQTVYEQAGKVTFQSNPRRSAAASTDGWTRSTADALGRVTEVATFSGTAKPTYYVPCDTTNPNCTGKVTSTYNANQTTVADQAGKVRRSVVNALGQLIRIDEPDANNNLDSGGTVIQPTSYTYDVLGNLTQVAQGVQTRTFTYSSLSRLTSATNPESGTINYEYDENGNLKKKINPRLVESGSHLTVTYVYDALNRLTSRSYNDGTLANNYSDRTATVTYTYDTLVNNKGRLASVSSTVSTYNYTGYDALGRVTGSSQVTDGQTCTMNYGYNLAGSMTSQTYPSGRVVETKYDAAGRIAGVKNQGSNDYYAGADSGDANRILYSAHGAVTTMKLGNTLWEHTSFNARFQPTEIGLGAQQGGIDKLKLNYAYGTTDNNGNVQSQTITVPGLTNPIVQTYSYDALNRLQNMSETGGLSQTFDYDRHGNRIITGGFVQDARVPHHLTQTDPTLADWYNQNTNQLKTEKYDVAGNIIKDTPGTNPGNTFDYDGENKQVRYNGGAAADGTDYKYDGDGRRVKKVTGTAQVTTIFVYNAMGQMVAEYTNTPPVPGSGGTSYLTSDTLGTPRVITSADGSVKARHDYLPFGEEIQANDLDSNVPRKTAQGYVSDNVRQKFAQYERDDETGLDFAQARYYSYSYGRFTSPDDFLKDTKTVEPASWNLYVYARNNPLKYIDPSGESVDGSRLTEEQRRMLINEFARISGYRVEDISFGSNGLLEIASGAKANGGSATARHLLNEAINSSWEFVLVSVSTTDVAFAEHAPTLKSPIVRSDGSTVSGGVYGEVRIDFADFNSAVFENNTARQTFSLGINVLHEFVHGLAPGLSDHQGGGAGQIENYWINPIRKELGLPTRDVYSASFISQEDRQQGVKLSFTRYETLPRIGSTRERTFPVTSHVKWQMNTVGGRIR